MTGRVVEGIVRPEPVELMVDGRMVLAHPGESLLASFIAQGLRRLRDDRSGLARGAFCNMGTCAECTVWIRRDTGAWRRRRACLVAVVPGLEVRTTAPEFA